MMMQRTLTPLLVVRDAARAVEFYVEALGAMVVFPLQEFAGERTGRLRSALEEIHKVDQSDGSTQDQETP